MSDVFHNPPDHEIRALLATPRTIAVVGCSPDPMRDSHRIARLLQRHGHRVIPVNPRADMVFGERCAGSLRDIDEPVHVVDVFRQPAAVPGIVDDAVAIGASALWLQFGVVHVEAALRARAAGMLVIMDRCPAVEYPRLFGATAEGDLP